MKKKTIILLICIGIFILFVISLASSITKAYNEMVTAEEGVGKLLSDLQVALQRRGDLIPNLVNTVKGEKEHELAVIDKVTTARSNLINANTVEEMAEANTQLTSSLKMLMLNITENYPEIATKDSFISLRDELAGTENRIAVARRDYNGGVQNFNLLIKKFPNNILAGFFGFEKAEYFEAESSSMGVPDVSFE